MKKLPKPTVFFNASVILAALINPRGGSGLLLDFIKEKKIKGIISEIILKEVIRNSDKIRKTEKEINRLLKDIFPFIKPPPTKLSVMVIPTYWLQQSKINANIWRLSIRNISLF